MATILIVRDGPAGLAAALLLARGGHQAVVFGRDGTPMHHAQLNNYLGVPAIRGSEFQALAREQVRAAGAELVLEEVSGAGVDDGRFVVRTASAQTSGHYLVLAAGKASNELARQVGVRVDGGHVPVDIEYRTNVDRVYVVGRSTRPQRSQAMISAGAGATAAIDILSREAGRDVHDWDSAPEHDHDHPQL